MRLKVISLGSASLVAMGFVVPASAQTTTPASGDPATPAAEAPAQGDAATDAAPGEDIVVTGLRRSLQSAQNIKRDSPQQLDAIVAEDIGKLPDVAVSDTAARIPGVQVERSGGEASRVLVRGLPDFNTTYNGRDIFTAESRSVALQDFPSGGIAAIEVFKTTTADLVEGGLAGEVNVRSRRPFDIDGFEIAGALWGQYTKRSEKFTPNGNLLISNRWDTGIGEIGALISGSYTRLRYLDSSRSNTDFVATPTIGPNASIVRIPDIQRVGYGVGDRTRPSVNGALQWRPGGNLEFYAEGLWQGFRNKVSDRELSVPLYGGASYPDVVLVDGDDGTVPRVESLTAVNPFRPDGFQGATYSKTDTYQYAGGGKYDDGSLKVSADVARTTSTFTNSIYSMDFAYAAPQTVTANTGVGGTADGPAFSYAGNFDPADPANYIYRGFFDRRQEAKGDDWQVRTDISYQTGVPGLTAVEGGLRFVDRDASSTEGSRYNPREGDRLPFSAIPVDYAVFKSGFPSGDPTTIRGYLTPTYDSLRGNIDEIRAFSGFAPGDPATDPQLTFATKEKSYAGYAQVKYLLGDEAAFHVDGALGLRIVKTSLRIDGFSVSNTPVTFRQNYTDWLPNLSAVGHFTDKLQLRLSFTQTRTRPSFGQYNPGTFINPQTAGGASITGARGNPNLQPFRSKNYDASLEYYFGRAGFVSGAIFQRDISGLIQNADVTIVDPVQGPVRVTQPFNLRDVRIKGFEAQASTFFDVAGLPEWLNAFGAQANVTYLDAPDDVVGVSKWAYNLVGFYEKNGLSARLSYNHRGAYLTRTEFRGLDPYSETVRGVGRLDFSGSYDVTKNVTLTADATNILAKPFQSDLTYGFSAGADPAVFPRIVRYEESVYSLGVRFRF